MTKQEKYEQAIRALKNIASRTFSNREIYAAAQLKELGEDYPRWIDGLKGLKPTPSVIRRLVREMSEVTWAPKIVPLDE